MHTNAYTQTAPRVQDAVTELAAEFTPKLVDIALLDETTRKFDLRVAELNRQYEATVCGLLSLSAGLSHCNYRSLVSWKLHHGQQLTYVMYFLTWSNADPPTVAICSICDTLLVRPSAERRRASARSSGILHPSKY